MTKEDLSVQVDLLTLKLAFNFNILWDISIFSKSDFVMLVQSSSVGILKTGQLTKTKKNP